MRALLLLMTALCQALILTTAQAAPANPPALAASATGKAAAPAPAPVQVLVLGSYHFGNPGLDTHNLQVASVLSPRRQAELDALARALLAFKPTQVMVEMPSTLPGLVVRDYQTFSEDRLLKEANEIVQIGYRTARLAGLAVVQGIDEQPGDGEPDYYPYDKVQTLADALGQVPLLNAANAPVVAFVKTFEQRQQTDSVAQLLMSFNDTAANALHHAPMYRMLAIGDTQQQAGAELNAMWYLRNAKIFAKLMSLVRPGDRVLVVFGAGHGYWLRHFAQETPGFQNVPVGPYLARAQAAITRLPPAPRPAASGASR